MGVLDSIGNTPLVKLETLNTNPRVTVFAKLEGNNPGGSVKDRIALVMIRDAEETGRIKKGDTILEATSGNTGIGLAMVGAALGYKVVLVMPECVSMERRKILEAFGAELILSPGNEGTDGAIKLARANDGRAPGQIFHAEPVRQPREHPGPLRDHGPGDHRTDEGRDRRVRRRHGHDRHAHGRGQAAQGVSTAGIRIVGVEPLLGHKIQGLKNMQESIVPKIFNPAFPDEIVNVNDDRCVHHHPAAGARRKASSPA